MGRTFALAISIFLLKFIKLDFFKIFMRSSKNNIIELIQKFPQNASYKDIQYEIYVHYNIEKKLEDINKVDYTPHKEAMERLKKWLK